MTKNIINDLDKPVILHTITTPSIRAKDDNGSDPKKESFVFAIMDLIMKVEKSQQVAETTQIEKMQAAMKEYQDKIDKQNAAAVRANKIKPTSHMSKTEKGLLIAGVIVLGVILLATGGVVVAAAVSAASGAGVAGAAGAAGAAAVAADAASAAGATAAAATTTTAAVAADAAATAVVAEAVATANVVKLLISVLTPIKISLLLLSSIGFSITLGKLLFKYVTDKDQDFLNNVYTSIIPTLQSEATTKQQQVDQISQADLQPIIQQMQTTGNMYSSMLTLYATLTKAS